MAQNPILAVTTKDTAGTSVAGKEPTLVNPILKAAEDYAIKTQVKAEAQQRVISTQQDILGTVISSTKKALDANKTIETQKQVADLQAQNNTIEIYKAGGGLEFQKTLMMEQQAAAAELLVYEDRLTDINAQEHTGIAIIDTVINQISGMHVAQQANQASRKLEEINKATQGISATTESAARVHNLTKETLNESTIQAMQEKLAADASAALAETSLKVLSSNADMLKASMQADAAGLDAQLTAYKIQNEEENRKIRLQEFELSKQAAARTATDWKENREVKQDVVDAVQRAQALTRTPIEDETTIKYGLTQGGTVGERYNTLFQLGVQKTRSIGPTPGDAIVNLAKVATTGIEATPATEVLKDIKEAAIASVGGVDQPKPPKTEEDYKTLLTKVAEKKATEFSTDITTGDKTNWYHAPDFSVLAENSVAVKSSPLYEKVLKPLEMKEFDPQKIMAAAVAGITSKTINIEEAIAGITTVAKSAAAYNNATKDFDAIGLPPQLTYNVRAEIPGTLFATRIPVVDWGFKALDIPPTLAAKHIYGKDFPQAAASKQTVDMMDETQIRNIIIRSISSSRLGESFTDLTKYETKLEGVKK